MLPTVDTSEPLPPGTRDRLQELGAEKFAHWMLDQKQVLLTDTTMRDAHQSLFATRMRTADMLPIAPFYARELPQLFSLECWGGATFDVAMRFLKEDPWERLAQLRERGAQHPVPDAAARLECRRLHELRRQRRAASSCSRRRSAGIDLFRVFDSLNWVREHARGDRRGARNRRAVRRRDLLHRRSVRPLAARSTT